MTDPAPNPERHPSPGVQLPPSLPVPAPVAETFNPAEAEPLPPVHEEEEPLQHQHQHEPPPQPQQPPPFQPLFTLVTDSTTRATHHPRVHYIFSDDDPDILTEALAHHGAQKQYTSVSPSGSGTTLEGRDRARRPSTTSTIPNNNNNNNNNERVIVLDLVPKNNNNNNNNNTTVPHPDEYSAAANAAMTTTSGGGGGGYEVAWASSLSSDWAVVSARISPMADDINASSTGATAATAADPDDEDPQQQLILRLEGLGFDAAPSSSPPQQNPAAALARRSSTATIAAAAAAAAAGRRPSLEERDLRMSGSSGAPASAPGQGQERGAEDYTAIMDEFDKRMGVLRRVLGAGMERQRGLAADEEDLGHEGLASATHAHDWGAAAAGAVTGGGGEQQRLGRATSSSSMRPSDNGE